MNTKGMKFLAVLAVLAMAFAAFAVIAPAETDDATEHTEATYDQSTKTITFAIGVIETTTPATLANGTAYYISEDATVTIDNNVKATVFLLKDKTVQISQTTAFTGYSTVAIYAVDSATETTLTLVNGLKSGSVVSDSGKSYFAVNTVAKESWKYDAQGDKNLSLTASGDSGKYKATSTGVAIVAADSAYNIALAGASYELTGTFGILTMCAGESYSTTTQTLVLSDFTGTIKSLNATKYKLILSGFTGTLSLTADEITMTAFTTGTIGSSTNTPNTVVKIKSDLTIAAGKTLTVAGSGTQIYIASGKTLTVYGTLTTDGNGTAAGTAVLKDLPFQGVGTIEVMSGGSYITDNGSVTGQTGQGLFGIGQNKLIIHAGADMWANNNTAEKWHVWGAEYNNVSSEPKYTAINNDTKALYGLKSGSKVEIKSVFGGTYGSDETLTGTTYDYTGSVDIGWANSGGFDWISRSDVVTFNAGTATFYPNVTIPDTAVTIYLKDSAAMVLKGNLTTTGTSNAAKIFADASSSISLTGVFTLAQGDVINAPINGIEMSLLTAGNANIVFTGATTSETNLIMGAVASGTITVPSGKSLKVDTTGDLNLGASGVIIQKTGGELIKTAVVSSGTVTTGEIIYTGGTEANQVKLNSAAEAVVTPADESTLKSLADSGEKVTYTAALTENITISEGTTLELTYAGDIGANVTVQGEGTLIIADASHLGSSGNNPRTITVKDADGNVTGTVAPGATALTGAIEVRNGSIYIIMNGSGSANLVTGEFAVSGDVKISGYGGNNNVLNGAYDNSVTLTATPGTTITMVDDLAMAGNLIINNTTPASGDVLFVLPAGKKLTLGATTGTESTYVLTVSLGNGVKMTSEARIISSPYAVINVAEGASFYSSESIDAKLTGAGSIMIDEAQKTLNMSSFLASGGVVLSATQKVIVDQNLTIETGKQLVIRGELYIPAGKTLTIEDGAQLMIDGITAKVIVDGTLKSMGEYTDGTGGFYVAATGDDGVIINGQLLAQSSEKNDDVSVQINAFTYVTGEITVASKATLSVSAEKTLVIAPTGEMTVKGTFNGTIVNQGLVVIDGDLEGVQPTVYMNATTAVLDIQSLKSGTLTVTDDGMYMKTQKNGEVDQKYYVGDEISAYDVLTANAITFANVKGITVTEGISYYTDSDDYKWATNYTYLSGTATPAVTNFYGGTAVVPTITVSGGYGTTVKDVFSLSKVIMIVDGGSLSVSGTVNVYDDFTNYSNAAASPADPRGLTATLDKFITDLYIKPTGAGMKVSGEVISVENELVSESKITAVKYETKESGKTVYHYTTLAKAIAAGADDVTVLGDLYILADTTIPAGYTVDASGKTVYVGSKSLDITDVTLTLKDGSELAASAIYVDGTMIVEDIDDLICNTVYADTSAISEDSGVTSAMYTNIYTALGTAEYGDEITITARDPGYVYLDKDITVPTGVTLNVQAMKTLFVKNGVTLTVDGTLVNRGSIESYKYNAAAAADNGFFYIPVSADETTYYSVIKVNGAIQSITTLSPEKYFVNGAYMELNSRYVITTLEQAVYFIDDVQTINVYGENTVADCTASASDAAGKIQVKSVSNGGKTMTAVISAATIALDNCQLVIDAGQVFSGKVINANGKVELKNVKAGTGGLTIEDKDLTSYESARLYIGGAFTGIGNNAINQTSAAVNYAKSVSATITGDVYANDLSLDTKNKSGAGKFTVASGSTFYIIGKTVTVANTNVQIDGTLVASNDGRLNATATTATVTVAGTIDAKAAAGSAAKGKVDTYVLYIGGSTNDVAKQTSAGASVSGAVTFSKVAYLFPGSTVSGEIADAMSAVDAIYTEFYVEGSLWCTVFAKAKDITVYDGEDTYNFKPKMLEDCEFVKWQSYSTTTGKYSDLTNVTYIGDKNKLYASIKYDIYNIYVIADIGIDAVYLDGNIMTGVSGFAPVFGGTNANAFVAEVVAGQHVITYVLANGYGGDAVMTVDGNAVLGGYGFKISDENYDFDADMVKITLTGIEKVGYDTHGDPEVPAEPETWTITTILLVILVILIAVMAVIVALRLNRS